MSYAAPRGMTGELLEGITDGSSKKVVRDRGGVIDQATLNARRDLYDTWYGIHEDPLKVDPFGRIVRTPGYRATRPLNYPGG